MIREKLKLVTNGGWLFFHLKLELKNVGTGKEKRQSPNDRQKNSQPQ
ncbi:hypothetical protein AB6C98_17055 [Vibrio splendidus]